MRLFQKRFSSYLALKGRYAKRILDISDKKADSADWGSVQVLIPEERGHILSVKPLLPLLCRITGDILAPIEILLLKQYLQDAPLPIGAMPGANRRRFSVDDRGGWGYSNATRNGNACRWANRYSKYMNFISKLIRNYMDKFSH